jgi:hypothetical protein
LGVGGVLRHTRPIHITLSSLPSVKPLLKGLHTPLQASKSFLASSGTATTRYLHAMSTIAVPATTPPTGLPSRDEKVRIGYTKWLPVYETEKPYTILSDLRTADHQDFSPTNLETEHGEPEMVQDIRGRERDFGLDVHGFQVARHEWAMRDWLDVAAVEREYLPEVKRFLSEQIPGIKDVHLYNWRVSWPISTP